MIGTWLYVHVDVLFVVVVCNSLLQLSNSSWIESTIVGKEFLCLFWTFLFAKYFMRFSICLYINKHNSFLLVCIVVCMYILV